MKTCFEEESSGYVAMISCEDRVLMYGSDKKDIRYVILKIIDWIVSNILEELQIFLIRTNRLDEIK